MSPLRSVDDPDRLRALVAAVLAISSDLAPAAVLRHIVESAVTLVDARYGALGVLDATGEGLSEFVNCGMSDAELEAIGEHPDSYSFPPDHPPAGSFLGVPIRVRGQVFGQLYLADKQGAPDFTDEDEVLAVALAGAAGLTIENTRLLARLSDLSLLEDRERIAADLHDTVIQQLFATGLALQGAARIIEDPAASARVQDAVDQLDDTVRRIRSTIFGLQPAGLRNRGLAAEIEALVAESAVTLGFTPHLEIRGRIDLRVDDSVAAQVLQVLREGLSNVVRHAAASRVALVVAVGDGGLVATITDDGVGAGNGERRGGQGLTSLRHRAETLGGTLEVSAGPDATGTMVQWRVPLEVAAGS